MANISGSSTAEVDAPLAKVWEVIADVESAPEWQGGMSALVALERDGDGRATLCETHADAKVRTIKTQVRFSYDGPQTLSWVQVKGDLKSLDGSWKLEDLDGTRTRATYSLQADPGRVLGMLVRGPTEGLILELLVNKRASELKRFIEGA